MVIRLYNTTDDNRVVRKKLSGEITKECILKGAVNVVEPIIELHGNIINSNYCYIPDFKRYYYIVDNTLHNNITTLRLKSDVLMSSYNDIKNLSAIVRRNTNINNKYINDDKYITQQNTRVQTKEFSTVANNYSYILLVCGGN